MATQKIRKAAIVIPTYNEATNIPILLDRIYENQKKLAVKLHVLVVDDSSPDGTADVVKQYAQQNKQVHILVRKEKQGLGAAYIHGMKHALELIKPDILFEMDADGQHNPDDIPKMIKAINEGNDFVIGSRYIEGGSISGDWGFHRKIISFLAGFVTRVGLRLNNIKDASGGYRAIRKEVFDSVDLDKLDVKGYAFQAALLEAVVYHKFKIKEVPITFNQRIEGESKMRVSDMLEGWVIVFKIRGRRFIGKGA